MPSEQDRVHNHAHLKERRRELRNGATPAERALWKLLKSSQLESRKFRRQYSIGSYVLDFYCPAEKLGVELDGAVHDDPFRRAYDSQRSVYLHKLGIKVVRFENNQVLEQPEIVLQAITWHFVSSAQANHP